MEKGKKPTGIAIIYNKSYGELGLVQHNLMPHLSKIVANLVKEGYITTKEQFDKIADDQMLLWGRVEDDKFKTLGDENGESLAAIAIGILKVNTSQDVVVSDVVDAIFYDGSKAPWGFDIFVCVLYNVEGDT